MSIVKQKYIKAQVKNPYLKIKLTVKVKSKN